MKSKISVILPIYNVDKYLEESLNSIINQSLGFGNIQVIMINDGSTDNCGQIIEEYSKKYENFISFHFDKPHGTPGAVRNKGLEMATGEYCMFLDPDDLYDKKTCELMYNAIINTNCDFVTSNYQKMDETGVKWDYPNFNQEKFNSFKLFQTTSDFNKSFSVFDSSACVKIFKMDFIKNNNIKFLEGCRGEDAFFSYSALIKSKNVYYIDSVLYYYRIRNIKSKTASISYNCTKEFFEELKYAYNRFYELFKKENQLEYYRHLYFKNLTYILYKLITSTDIGNEDKKEIFGLLYDFFERTKILKVSLSNENANILINNILEKKYNEALNTCIEIQKSLFLLDNDSYNSIVDPSENIDYLKI